MGVGGAPGADRVDGLGAPLGTFAGARRDGAGPAHDVDSLGGVGEPEASFHGDDLHGAFLDPAVTTTCLGVPDRDVHPGQPLRPLAQGGLIPLDADQQVSAPFAEVGQVFDLGVQRVHTRPAQTRPVTMPGSAGLPVRRTQGASRCTAAGREGFISGG